MDATFAGASDDEKAVVGEPHVDQLWAGRLRVVAR